MRLVSVIRLHMVPLNGFCQDHSVKGITYNKPKPSKIIKLILSLRRKFMFQKM
jgi:hypothetical protein